MRRLAHVSDLHFGHVDPAVVEGLAASLREAAPDLVVISGDFTQSAREEEFRAARAFIDGLKLPVFAVPGNHDLPNRDILERFFDPYARYRRWIAQDLEPSLVDDEMAIIGIKSSRRFAPRLNWAHGRIGRRQLADILAQLAALPPGLVRIVVVHHPLLLPETLPKALPKSAATEGAREALDAFAANDVKLVLSGHLHLSYSRQHAPARGAAGAPTAVLPDPAAGAVAKPATPLPAGPLIVQAASATSTRLRDEPNAYNWITIDGGQVTVEVRAWDGTRLFAAVKAAPTAEPNKVHATAQTVDAAAVSAL